MIEVWKDIEGFEGLYQVSNMGRVKSLKRNKQIIKKTNKDGWGYLHIDLYKDGKGKMYKIHRLVARAFIDNPYNLPQVNHKDEDKTNNSVDNLEWCTRKYNCNYGTAIQRRTEKMTNGKNSKAVFQYNMSGEFVKEYPSVMEVQRQLKYANTNISQCCLGKRKTAYGYIWRYAD